MVTIKHASLTGAAANPGVLVDGPKWDANHTLADLSASDVSYTASGWAGTAVTLDSLLDNSLLATNRGIYNDASHAAENDTAIAAAIAYCVANNRTLVFTDGTYWHSAAINWAYNGLKVMVLGDNVVFLHTGTGIAHNFSGIANYPASQGCASGVFGGPGRPMLRGNPAGGTTRVVNIDNWHYGYMKVALQDGATCLYGRNTGIVGASAAQSTFDIRITQQDGLYAVRPGHGVDFSEPVACVFDYMVVEACGAGGLTAVVLTGASNNRFNGGIIQSNLGPGITEDSTSNFNTFFKVACEANSGANDWAMSGRTTVLIQCTGGGANGNSFNGTSQSIISGLFYNAVIGGDGLWSNGTDWGTTFTNGGTNTTILNPLGVGVARASFTGSIAVTNNVAATTFNNVGIATAGATASLNFASGKALTVNNIMSLTAGADSKIFTFPATDATIARTDAGQTFTGTQTIGALVATTVNGNTFTTGTYTLTGVAGKTFTFSNTLTLAGTDGSTLNIGAGGTLGSNAYTSTAYAPIASPTFTGTVTIPTPWTLGATSVTSTGTQLNYLNAATGTTGTTTTNVVFSTSPTLVTPALGVATATSINGNTFTTGTYTLTGTAGKTLTFSNSITLSGTDATTMTFPTTSATLARTDAANTFTGHQTIEGVTSTGATGTGKFVFDTAPTIAGGLHTAITSLGIRSTGAAFDLTLACTEVLTAGRTLTLKLNDAARTVDIAGNVTLAGALTTSGAFGSTFTMTGTTTVTLPTSGTLATLAGTEPFTNKTYNGNTWTAGTGVLTLGAGKTATISNTLTFTGTDSSSVACGAGGTVAYVANKLSVFAATTSAELAGVLSDETGSSGGGVAVFSNAPALTSPTVTTQSQGDNSTKAASTAYTDAAVAAKGTAVSVTPVWATSGTAPSLGNGTLVGTVCRLGPTLLLASIKLTFGSTTNAGTGIWTFSLPSPYDGNAVAFCSGNAHFADTGVLDYYGFAEMVATTNVIYPIYNGNVISSIAPFIWGSGDYAEFNLLLIGP